MTDQGKLLDVSAPLRNRFSIPYHDLGPSGGPPLAALVAGVHGDELNGVFVLARLANYLKAVEQKQFPAQELRARVIIIPAVNVRGLNLGLRGWPFDKADINRMFPGYDAGETTQRIANAVIEQTREAAYRVDIHSSNREFEELPQVRLYDPSNEERATAPCFQLPAVIERPANKIFSATLGSAWRAYPGQNFILQVGQAGAVQPDHCDQLFRALVRFLGHIGALTGVSLADEDESHLFGPTQTFALISESSGFFLPRGQVGDWLLAGSVIGQVYDGFSGAGIASITAPVAGLLSGLRRQPLLFQGDLIARIQTRHTTHQAVDTYLQGHGQ